MQNVPLIAGPRRGRVRWFLAIALMLAMGFSSWQLVGLHGVEVAKLDPLSRVTPAGLGPLKTIATYQIQGRQVIFMSENGAVPNVPMPVLVQVETSYAQFAGRSMASNVDSLGLGNPLEAEASIRKPTLQYVVFSSNKSLFGNTKKQETGTVEASGWGYSVTGDPAASMALIRVPTVGEIPPDAAAPETEMCQVTLGLAASSASVDRYNAYQVSLGNHYLDNEMQATLDLDAQEVFCNSVGRAANSARTGQSYDDYAAEAGHTGFGVGNSVVASIIFDRPTYDALASAR